MSTRLPSDQLAETLARRCLELCEVTSVTGDEAKIADHLHRWAKGLSRPLTITRHGNSLVLGALDDPRPGIGLVGHLDTVPPHPSSGPARREADKVIGLGASDMKGALAIMTLLCEELDLASLPYSLVCVFYDREEGPYADNGLAPLIEACPGLRDLDFALCMEPTDNTLQLGCVGTLNAKVTFRGRAAHSARPWQGDNAVHKAWPLLKTLAERGWREVQVEGLVFRDAMSVTLAHGGRAKNVVPEELELNINYRFPPVGSVEQASERAKAELRRVVGDDPGVTLEIVDLAPPGTVPRGHPFLEHLRAEGGLSVEPKQAWTDVARFAAIGVDAANYGPGATGQAHQQGEWISISAMAQCYDVLWRTLRSPLST